MAIPNLMSDQSLGFLVNGGRPAIFSWGGWGVDSVVSHSVSQAWSAYHGAVNMGNNLWDFINESNGGDGISTYNATLWGGKSWGYATGVGNAPANYFTVSESQPDAPSTEAIAIDSTINVDAPVLSIDSMREISIPDFTAVAPYVSIPDRPDATVTGDPGDAPEVAIPHLPDAPSFSMPDLPSVQAVDLPDVPMLELPTFDHVAPEYDLTPPSNTFSWNEAQYTSELLGSAISLLQADIENGGYGIDPRDEQALWERARDREQANADGALLDLEQSIAARGFSIPPGALMAATQKAIQASRAQLSALQRDISIKRAELYVQNRQFALTTGLNAEQFMMQFHGSIQERALNASKYLVDASISAYNASVAGFNARMELFRAHANVYEQRIRALLAKVDIYKTQIEAASMKLRVNESYIELYKAQLAGINSMIDIYRNQVGAVQVVAEIERLRLQGFSEKVQAYAAKVRAKSDEFGMYESAVRGEMSKVDLFKSQVSAFSEQVGAAKVVADVESTKINAQIASGELRLKEYAANIDKAKTQISANIDKAKMILSRDGLDVELYAKQSDLGLKWEALRLDAWKQSRDDYYKNFSYNLDKAKTEISASSAAIESRMKASNINADIFKSLHSAQQSSINAIASMAG